MIKMLKFIEINNIAQKQPSIIKFYDKKSKVKSITFKSLEYFLRKRNKGHLK